MAALTAAVAGLGASGVSASADSTTTGWDRTNASGSISDANKALSSARSDIASQASSRAASVTSSAPTPSSEAKIGWVDVYVDHTNLDDAVTYATARGVNVTHDDTVVKEGDASATAQNRSEAISYYAAKAAEAKSTADKYVRDQANYQSQKEKNQQDADTANNSMNSLRSALSAQGQTNKMESKQYSAEAVKNDTAAIQNKLADGKAYLAAKAAVDKAKSTQASLTLLASAEAAGNVHLRYQNATIANDGDANHYISELQNEYQQLQTYLAGLPSQIGSIPDSQRPTYTLYNFSVDSEVERKGTEVVTTYNYTPVPVAKPVQPSFNYHIYDIRDQMTSTENWDNKDGEVIILQPNQNAGGKTVAQAMVNQTVGIATDNQPLPADRFDKIEDLTVVTRIPDNAEFDKAMTNSDPANWIVTYDEDSRTVRMTATPEYLVQVNLNQNINKSGTVGGTVDGEWKYKSPQVYFKLLKDNETYQTHSTIIVNKEYQFVGADIQIRTDQADPTKANTNSKYQLIDGKEVLPGSINNYIMNWDFNQYKGVNIDRSMQQAGLVMIDDYPEEAVSLTGPIRIVNKDTGEVLYTANLPANANNIGASGSFVGANGQGVDGLTWTVVDKTNAPDGVKDKISGKALMVKYAKIDGDFYKKYVETGTSLNILMPMTTLKIDNTAKGEGYNGNKYSNIAYQSDFGNVYTSNRVENTAPKIDPNKDAVVSFGDLTSLDINKNPQSTIEHQSYFAYRLNGTTFSTKLSENITDYRMEDSFETDSDRYDGEFTVQTDNAIVFKAGSTLAERYPSGIAAGSDVSKYFTQKIDRTDSHTNIAKITLSADRDFLDQIDMTKTSIHFDAYVNMKRIANKNGVRNQYKEIINGVDYGSNIVVTNSRKNAIDLLNEKLQSLASSASSAISSNASGIASNASKISSNASGIASNASAISSNASSFASALSVVIKTITDVRDSASSAISSVASTADSIASSADSAISSTASSASSALSSTASSLDSAISSTASSASSAIDSNSSAISDVKSSAASAMSAVASDAASAISKVAEELAKRTEQKLSRLAIYDKSVTSKVEALNYASKYNILPSQVRSIEYENGAYVIMYNASLTAINGQGVSSSVSATTKIGGGKSASATVTAPVATPAAAPAVKTSTYDLYTAKNEAEARNYLASIGVDTNKIQSMKLVNGHMHVVVKEA